MYLRLKTIFQFSNKNKQNFVLDAIRAIQIFIDILCSVFAFAMTLLPTLQIDFDILDSETSVLFKLKINK